MPWQTRYIAEHDLIASDFTDQITPAELMDCVLAGIALSKAHGTNRYLCDASGLTGGHNVFDLYALAEQLHTLGVPPGTREAVIVPREPATSVDASFWETVCRNRGFEVCSFVDRDDALAWLLREDVSKTGT